MASAGHRIEGELLPADKALDGAGGLSESWDSLAGRSLEPNAFLARWMVEARLKHLPDRAGAKLLLAWRGEGPQKGLVGLALLVRPRGRQFNPFAVLRAAELYAPLSTPLVDPERPAETWSAMLAALAAGGHVGLALPFLVAGGPVSSALREAATAGSLPLAVLDVHRRAFLASPLSGEDYVRTTLVPKRRKEADRQRRRLAELGRLELDIARSEARVAAAVESFLALERSGWKGRSGTDLATAPGGSAFFREAAAAGARAGSFRVVSLSLDARMVAAGLVAIAGRRAFYVKTAYDENFARHSPGVLLTLDLTALLLDDPAIDDADSVAHADHPMIDRIWSGRLEMERVFVSTRTDGSAARLALGVERARDGALAAAKAVRDALVRRRPEP